MIIENCPKCKGTHLGSYECPIFCICCANGNDLPEGEYCRACGRGNAPLPLRTRPTRPAGSNADEWNLFLEEVIGRSNSYLAVQIAEAIDDAVRRGREG
jgi:hypothetical protein